MRMVEELKLGNSSEGLIDYTGIEELFPMMTQDDLNKVEQMVSKKDGSDKKKIVRFVLIQTFKCTNFCIAFYLYIKKINKNIIQHKINFLIIIRYS